MEHSLWKICSIICLVNGLPLPSARFKKCNPSLKAWKRRSGIGAASPFEVNRCLDESRGNASCAFDVVHCNYQCEFGYAVDDAGCPFQNCSCASGGTFEGDIKFDSEDIPLLIRMYNPLARDISNGASIGRPRWNKVRLAGRVKIGYELAKNLSMKAERAIATAMERYSNNTCIDFVPKTNEEDYLVFMKERGCWSYVGRRGGPQAISIGFGCAWTGIVQHEILHALGFWHEQSRPDRDEYIEVKLENVVERSAHNFKKRNEIDSFGSPYDKLSIMHYGGYTFTATGKPTIIDKITGQPIVAQREDLTKSDLRQVNEMYGCTEDRSRGYWTEWSPWTACARTCGKATRNRRRTCMEDNLPMPENYCDGRSWQEQNCSVSPCPTKEAWSSWHAWSSCSMTCGNGYQLRLRTCGAEYCTGDNWEVRNCNVGKCKTGLFSVVVKSPATCKDGEIVLSDFNKDGKDDLFCFHSDGGMEIFVSCLTPFSKKFWEGKIQDCDGRHHCGDFNGDGFEDILCVEEEKGFLHLTIGKGGTFESTSNWQGEIADFCRNGEITPSYVTGRERMDIVCVSNDGNFSALITSLVTKPL